MAGHAYFLCFGHMPLSVDPWSFLGTGNSAAARQAIDPDNKAFNRSTIGGGATPAGHYSGRESSQESLEVHRGNGGEGEKAVHDAMRHVPRENR
ncbi:MAG: hypothetical protein P8Z30_19730 [Acidobacteriota bacterium]